MARPTSGLPSPDQVREWLRAAAADPASLPDEGYEALLGADGRQLEELCELADSLRQQAAGNALTYVVNRNLDTSAVAGADPGSRERLAALVAEARELGATEICMQGPLPADSDDDYLDLIAAVNAAAPGSTCTRSAPRSCSTGRPGAGCRWRSSSSPPGRRGSARFPVPPRASSTTRCGPA